MTQQTQRVAVLSDAETATGYRLAGAEVIEATPETAVQELERLIQENRYGLIAVDTGLIPDPLAATTRVMRGRDLPILLPIPSLRDAFARYGGCQGVHEQAGARHHRVRYQAVKKRSALSVQPISPPLMQVRKRRLMLSADG